MKSFGSVALIATLVSATIGQSQASVGSRKDVPKEFFRGSATCTGPFVQPQLELPADYIQISVQWDETFRNSDVTFRFGPSLNGGGSTRLSPYYAGQFDYPEAYGWLGGFLWKDKKYEISLNLLDEESDGTQIQSGSLRFDGNYYYLKCKENR